MSKNAEGWIRHRGGKCPVDKGVRVDVRYRSGMVNEHVKALESVHPDGSVGLSAVTWEHYGSIHDIMAYRLHKPAEQVEACSKPDPRDSAKRDSDYVCWMRDRIAEIDATTQALKSERAELVQKLASEGFALIGRINDLLTDAAQKHEDMSDWRNWKVGDLIVRVSDKKISGMPLNEPMEINRIDANDPDQPARAGNGLWPYLCDVKWHSRPSA